MIIFLVGMPGAGKSYFGRFAAQELNLNCIDLDERISEEQNTSIKTLFDQFGESYFRNLESECLKRITKECKTNTIIICGGGTPCFHDNMSWMNSHGITIWLDCPLEEIEKNHLADLEKRPLFDALKGNMLKDKLEALFAQRQNFYAQSKVKLNVNKGLSPYLFTKQLHLSTFVKNN